MGVKATGLWVDFKALSWGGLSAPGGGPQASAVGVGQEAQPSWGPNAQGIVVQGRGGEWAVGTPGLDQVEAQRESVVPWVLAGHGRGVHPGGSSLPRSRA